MGSSEAGSSELRLEWIERMEREALDAARCSSPRGVRAVSSSPLKRMRSLPAGIELRSVMDGLTGEKRSETEAEEWQSGDGRDEDDCETIGM